MSPGEGAAPLPRTRLGPREATESPASGAGHIHSAEGEGPPPWESCGRGSLTRPYSPVLRTEEPGRPGSPRRDGGIWLRPAAHQDAPGARAPTAANANNIFYNKCVGFTVAASPPPLTQWKCQLLRSCFL